jgi:hypothetical protein
VVALLLLLVWERQVSVNLDDWVDSPAMHSLAYFKDSACAGRAPSQRKPDCRPARTELTQVGSVGALAIYDLKYYLEEDSGRPDHVGAKSILVKSGTDAYREIYFHEGMGIVDGFTDTEVVNVGGQAILHETYDEGGMYHILEDIVFSLDATGNKVMDLDPIYKAASKKVPSDLVVYLPATGINFKTMTWHGGTEPKNLTDGPKVSCCDGEVTVVFKIERGKFVPIRATYKRTQ